MSTIFDDRRPQPPMTLKLKVSHRTYAYIVSLTPKDIKNMRPSDLCTKGKAKEEQGSTYSKVETFKRQPVRREGDFMIVDERYTPSKSGFPGRLWSHGSQNWWNPLRSLLYEDYAELDQQRSIHRIVKWVCKTFGVRAALLDSFLGNPDAYLRDVMTSEGCTKKQAKYLFQLAWTNEPPLARIKDVFLKAFDAEAKVVRAQLMHVEALKFIVDASNGPGSFLSNLSYFVEAKLSANVCRALQERGVPVYSSVFDGLYFDRSLYGSTDLQHAAFEACEEVAPGIGMTWGWKYPDPTVYDKDGHAIATISVPDDFVPTAARENEWDPETQPTYDDFADPREGHEQVYEGMYTNFSQMHCKVGSTFVDSDKQPGKYVFTDETKLIKEYKHRVTYSPPSLAVDADGMEYLRAGEVEKDFIHRWLTDPRMDPLYHKDKSCGNYWKYFDCYPKEDDCPDDCFNTWRGFAADDLTIEEEETARDHLRTKLEHIVMLCSGNAEQYNFLLDLLAHAVQYPEDKVGIMLCLVGPKGCGKTQLWNLIRAVFGEAACFETEHPDRDVWGDNNSCIMDKYWVRITEASRKKFAGFIGEVRTKITDPTIRVRALYGAAENVKSYHRFFLDTNHKDAIPDEHGERRFFIIDCSGEKVGDKAYFTRLAKAIESPEGVRAFYELLMKRACKAHYIGDDIPVGEYARKLKDHNRSHGELFVQAIVREQPVDEDVLVATADEIYSFYTKWQTSGHEFDRSKIAVNRMLGLTTFPGIKKKSKIDNATNKWYQEYTFDLVQLRKFYGMDLDIEEARETDANGAQEAAIDVDRDIESVFGVAECEEPSPKRARTSEEL